MIKLTVLYPNTDDIQFDKDYYTDKHMKLLVKLTGNAIISADINYGISAGSPDKQAPYHVITNLVFESIDSFQSSFVPNIPDIMSDLSNFTNAEPVIQLSEIYE